MKDFILTMLALAAGGVIAWFISQQDVDTIAGVALFIAVWAVWKSYTPPKGHNFVHPEDLDRRQYPLNLDLEDRQPPGKEQEQRRS